jgi:hypothetical protein
MRLTRSFVVQNLSVFLILGVVAAAGPSIVRSVRGTDAAVVDAATDAEASQNAPRRSSPKLTSDSSDTMEASDTTPPDPKLLAMLNNVRVDMNDPVQARVLADYGAMFVARGGAVPPPTVLFSNDDETDAWQAGVPTKREKLGAYTVELQAPAMEALLAARAEARAGRLDITARGSDAARRSYSDTVKLWASRVNPALKHWTDKKRITAAESARIAALSPHAQIPEVLALEKQSIWFSTDFSKSILYSVAAPGTSQHISMLALDVAEFENPAVREILARHGWFQTVRTDLPHFTYLGVAEEELPALGLKKAPADGRVFWIPDLGR